MRRIHEFLEAGVGLFLARGRRPDQLPPAARTRQIPVLDFGSQGMSGDGSVRHGRHLVHVDDGDARASGLERPDAREKGMRLGRLASQAAWTREDEAGGGGVDHAGPVQAITGPTQFLRRPLHPQPREALPLRQRPRRCQTRAG